MASRFRLRNRFGGVAAIGGLDVTAPTITSSNAINLAENVALSHTLTANEAVTWTKTGGADTGLFTLVGSNLSMTAKDFEIPVDADTNNTYVVQVTATDAALNATNQTITVTVTDVTEAPFEAETNALLARFTTPATGPRQTLINDLIVALKSAGVWTKYDAFYICAAETQQAAQRNWVVDAFNLTEVNAPAWVADRGYTPNGSTSYCDTGFNPITSPTPKFVQDNAYFGVWHRTDLAGIGATSSNDAGNANSRILNLSSTDTSLLANRSSVTNIGVSPYAIDKAYSRTGSAVWRYYISGVINGADPRTDTSSALTNFNFSIGRTTAAAFGLNQCSVFRFGSGFTTAEQLSEHNAIQNYMTAVGAG